MRPKVLRTVLLAAPLLLAAAPLGVQAAAPAAGASSAGVSGGASLPGNANLPGRALLQNPFATVDRAAAQRGFQVYKEVCSACHAMRQMHYRDLAGIGLSPAEIAAIAATEQMPGPPDADGQPTERPGRPADRFRSSFATETDARSANGGALPPDLSLIAKALPGGSAFIAALLQGYGEPPAGAQVPQGLFWNNVIDGHLIAMPPPLVDGQVSFADGTKASVPQMAHDVAAFLAFAADPSMEARHRAGVRAVLFLLVLLGLAVAVNRRIWARLRRSEG